MCFDTLISEQNKNEMLFFFSDCEDPVLFKFEFEDEEGIIHNFDVRKVGAHMCCQY